MAVKEKQQKRKKGRSVQDLIGVKTFTKYGLLTNKGELLFYLSGKKLLLGYDVFVKDDPASPEWIFYDSLADPVSLKETDMLRILDRMVSEHGLSYTESCFNRLDGKTVKKENPSL